MKHIKHIHRSIALRKTHSKRISKARRNTPTQLSARHRSILSRNTTSARFRDLQHLHQQAQQGGNLAVSAYLGWGNGNISFSKGARVHWHQLAPITRPGTAPSIAQQCFEAATYHERHYRRPFEISSKKERGFDRL